MRVPEDTTPRPPAMPPETPEEISQRRHDALAKRTLSREEMQEYLQDTIDPLSADELQWMRLYLENAGDWQAIADAGGITPRQARQILSRPRVRLALGRVLGNLASPEMIVAGLVDMAFGDDKVSGYWMDGSPQRIDHKLRQDALLALAKLRGLIVDHVHLKGVTESNEALDRLIASELARVRGILPGGSEPIVAEAVVGVASNPDVPPSVDPAGEPPVQPEDVDS